MTDFVDERGEIRNIKHTAKIFSEKGTVRSNHYHKEGWHYLTVIGGRMRYLARPVGSKEVETDTIIDAGGCVFTPPGYEHRCEFLEDTLMTSESGKVATGQPDGEYETDTVQVEW